MYKHRPSHACVSPSSKMHGRRLRFRSAGPLQEGLTGGAGLTSSAACLHGWRSLGHAAPTSSLPRRPPICPTAPRAPSATSAGAAGSASPRHPILPLPSHHPLPSPSHSGGLSDPPLRCRLEVYAISDLHTDHDENMEWVETSVDRERRMKSSSSPATSSSASSLPAAKGDGGGTHGTSRAADGAIVFRVLIVAGDVSYSLPTIE
jgi:hypothetical protein